MNASAPESRTERPAQPYRELLLAEMAKLCADAPRAREPAVRDGLGQVFARVLDAADPDARRRFAEREAAADWLSPALALRLARDEIAVAQPVIASSPALGEPELLALVAEGAAEHRAAAAARPHPSARLAEAVADTGEPLALAALAANPSDLPAPILRRLVEDSRRIVALRAPLVRRSDLYGQLARRLSEWVGPELHAQLAARFDLGEPAAADDAPDAQDRLIAKLEAAGQLKPGYLVRTLRDGKLALFEAALAALGRFAPAEVRRALGCGRADLLALACVAVGIDRSVFPTVLNLVRALNEGRPGGGAPEALEAALTLSDPAAAAEAFRSGVAAVAFGAL